MEKEKTPRDETNNFIKVVVLILVIAVCTFFILIWISPESKNLAKFLIGFGFSFVGIVLFVYFIKYIANIYKQIRNRK